jgi:hypothetical protein
MKKTKNSRKSASKKPKRNISAFIFFSKKVREELKAEHPEYSSNTALQYIAERWKCISPAEKEKYRKDAQLDKLRYVAQLNNYYISNDYHQIQKQNQKKKVKKPCSAYAIFVKRNRQLLKSENSSLNMNAVLKLLGQRWKILPAEEKEYYNFQAGQEKESYRKKMSQNMLEEKEKVRQVFMQYMETNKQYSTRQLSHVVVKEQEEDNPVIFDSTLIHELQVPKLSDIAKVDDSNVLLSNLVDQRKSNFLHELGIPSVESKISKKGNTFLVDYLEFERKRDKLEPHNFNAPGQQSMKKRTTINESIVQALTQ